MKRHCKGRRRGYGRLRASVESAMRYVYFGEWPAHLWNLYPTSSRIHIIHHRINLQAATGKTCRIVFLSDLHIGPTTPVRLLKKAFAHARTLQPDVLLLGGDYVFLNSNPSYLARLTDLVASVDCPLKYAVMGNHDLWNYDELIIKALQAGGATVLVNKSSTLPAPWNDIAIVGLDDTSAGRCDGARAFANLKAIPFRIVVCHSPDGLLYLGGNHFTIFLCGHTHGGQVAAPWGPLVVSTGRLCRQYSAGFSHFGAGEVFVSRGVGGVDIPMRFFAPPDILCLELSRVEQALSKAGL
jgi:predicted MPP superfamily phosphohydrolase